MSTLGIRFVLPYVGSNGIDVKGNVISIATDKKIEMQAIVLTPTNNQKGLQINTNTDIVADAIQIQNIAPSLTGDGNLLYISGNILIQLLSFDDFPSNVVNEVDLNSIQILFSDSNSGNISILNANNIKVPTIKTTINNGEAAPLMSFDSIDNGFTVDPTIGVILTDNSTGEHYASVSASGL